MGKLSESNLSQIQRSYGRRIIINETNTTFSDPTFEVLYSTPKINRIQKDWDQVEKEKYNYRLIPEKQIYKDKANAKEVTNIFNLLHERIMKDKNQGYKYIQLQADCDIWE
jgi:hypothetical protein